MKLLDLFCGGGGAGYGYSLAGFDVTGVDWKPQPAYPFAFRQGDALDYLREHGAEFDAIHASPPCQGYSSAVTHSDSRWVGYSRGKAEPQLIEPLRELLRELGKPYVIENVEGARGHMNAPIVLCGSMFAAHPRRHRLFEANWGLLQPGHPRCVGRDKAFAIANSIDYRDMSVTGKSRRTGSIDVWKRLMEMDWPGLRASDLAEAIPPRYTEYVGRQLRRYLHDSMCVSSTFSTRLLTERRSLLASRSNAAHVSGERRMVRDWRLDMEAKPVNVHHERGLFAVDLGVEGVVASLDREGASTEEVHAPASVGGSLGAREFDAANGVVAVADDEFVGHFSTSLVDTSMIPTRCKGSQLFSRAKARQRIGES